MTRLKLRGPVILQTILDSRTELIAQGNIDSIQVNLLDLISSETADSETADSETADSETADSETADSDTIN
jgi:hypothetical protein